MNKNKNYVDPSGRLGGCWYQVDAVDYLWIKYFHYIYNIVLVGFDIGQRLQGVHFGKILLPCDIEIGKISNISHENTLGVAGRGDNRRASKIDNFVYIGAEVEVISKIIIGNKIAIVAKVVVTRDVTDNAVVIGMPERVINDDSNRDFIEFNKARSKKFVNEQLIENQGYVRVAY